MKVKTNPEILYAVEDDELMAYIVTKLYVFENIVSKGKGAYRHPKNAIEWCKQFLNVIERWHDKYCLFSHLADRIAQVRTFMIKKIKEMREEWTGGDRAGQF